MKAAPTSSASAALASHIRRASVIASNSSTAVLSSSGSNGFETKRSAPATWASISAWLHAVITTTGISFNPSSVRNSSSTSIPERPGSITSSTIRSGRSSRASPSASVPSAASTKR